MPFDIWQYQEKTDSFAGAFSPLIPFIESTWHQPWSEPIRFLVSPRLRIAEIASGPFAPILDTQTEIIQFFESRWHQPWSEPKRFRLAIGAYRSPFISTFFDNTPNPSNRLQGWFEEFREPVWPRKGLRREYQQAYAAPVRYLPPANVTVIISPTEINTDEMEMDVFVYDEAPFPPEAIASANVTISEIPANTEANVSFREREPD